MDHFKEFPKLAIPSRKSKSRGKSAKPALFFHVEATDADMLYFSRFRTYDAYLRILGGRQALRGDS